MNLHTLEEIVARLENIEAKLAAAGAPRPVSSKPWPSPKPTVHPSTRRAEAKHNPPLTPEEIKMWCDRIAPGRRFKKNKLASMFFSNNADGDAKALRVCYWLKREGVLCFDSEKFHYYRPVPGGDP